jgi:hypothetical protein
MKRTATIKMLEELVRRLNETTYADYPKACDVSDDEYDRELKSRLENSTGKWPGIYHLSRKRFDKSGDLIRERRVPENKSWSIDGYVKQGGPGYTLLLAKNDGVSYLPLAGTQDWPKRRLYELVRVYLDGMIEGEQIGRINEIDDMRKQQEQEDEFLGLSWEEMKREDSND